MKYIDGGDLVDRISEIEEEIEQVCKAIIAPFTITSSDAACICRAARIDDYLTKLIIPENLYQIY